MSKRKQFIAVTNLHGEFAKGDVVPHGPRLQQLLAFGVGKFVAEDVPARKSTTPDVDHVDETKENKS